MLFVLVFYIYRWPRILIKVLEILFDVTSRDTLVVRVEGSRNDMKKAKIKSSFLMSQKQNKRTFMSSRWTKPVGVVTILHICAWPVKVRARCRIVGSEHIC